MKTFKKLLNISINIVIGILILFILLLIPLFFQSQVNKTPVTFLGKTSLVISSGSMTNSNLNIGDVVKTTKINPKNIRKNDIIAFYYFKNPNTPISLKQFIANNTFKSNNSFNELFSLNNQYYKKAIKSQAKLILHKVNTVKIDSNGELWFETFGTSNIDSKGNFEIDKYLTNQNYIVGKFENKQPITTSLLKAYRKIGVANFLIIILSLICFTNILELIFVIKKSNKLLKLQKRQLLITNPIFTPKFFKDVSLHDKALLLESAKPNELLIYKNKLFNNRFI